METISTNEYSDDVIRSFEAKIQLTKDSKKVKIDNDESVKEESVA